MRVTNWGKYPIVEAEVRTFAGREEALKQIESRDGPWIPRGLGRCYGDSSLQDEIISSLRSDRFLAFDAQRGVLECEAGVSFEAIIDHFLPKGWFLPVTPGTKFITVGGAIASDIHGKNHHKEGSFSRHLISFELLTATGEVLHCSREENPAVFEATCGGMGLTGLVTKATFKLRRIESAWIRQDTYKTRDLKEVMELIGSNLDYTYSVAWLDTLSKGKNLGRSLLYLGEHASLKDLKGSPKSAHPYKIPSKGSITVPFDLPGFVINPLSLKMLSLGYYHKVRQPKSTQFIDYDTYFYPLDSILHWNRGYGKQGFTQYQFVIPPESAYEGLSKILNKMLELNLGSFVTVLKYFGKQEGILSFPMEGYTLALDFPIRRDTFQKLQQLDPIVLDYGGRLYLTKDARMSRDMFQRSYPRLQEFLEIKQKLDPENRIRSLQFDRLMA